MNKLFEILTLFCHFLPRNLTVMLVPITYIHTQKLIYKQQYMFIMEFSVEYNMFPLAMALL
jgi:uncharacterized membrane protein YobD (UPF0266 family)